MRAFADIIAIVIAGFGLLFMLAGWLVAGTGAGGFVFILGLIMLAVGVIVSRSVSRKTCPQCADRVKYEALKCKHCGHEFVAPARSSISEPFYK